jgi:hypothetical protein
VASKRTAHEMIGDGREEEMKEVLVNLKGVEEQS